MTPPGSYAKGVRGEKKTRKWLEAQAFKVVESRGSHGAVDLIATSLYKVVAVQVKTGKPLSMSELEVARALLRSWTVPGCCGERWLVTWPDHWRKPIVEVVE